MTGPVDPSLIAPLDRLPDSRTWREMRDRTWARLRGRVFPADFDLTFEMILKWLDGHPHIGTEQATYSAHDLFVAMCGVVPRVTIQRCEQSGVVLLTIEVKSADGQQRLSRTRTVKITEPGDGSGAAVPLQRRRA